MRYFIDTEFIEDKGCIELLSIGIVAEDERTLYLETSALIGVGNRANEWVMTNVVPKFELTDLRNPISMIEDVLAFIGDDEQPVFWADYAAYDWVAFCSIFGRMIDLPIGYPMFCMDIQQAKEFMGIVEFPVSIDSQNPHHALADAWEVKRRYDHMFNTPINEI